MTGTTFDAAFDAVLAVEGGYSNDANDLGGATRWGITEAVARECGYQGEMALLSLDWARNIYRARYWQALSLDTVAALSPSVAVEVFECAVNQGPGLAARHLQRSLNALNRAGQDYSDITVDGAIGSRTIGALSAFLKRRGRRSERVLLKALNVLQGARYIEIVEARERNEAFLFGWLDRRVEL